MTPDDLLRTFQRARITTGSSRPAPPAPTTPWADFEALRRLEGADVPLGVSFDHAPDGRPLGTLRYRPRRAG